MNYAALIKAINAATDELQGRAATVVNQALVLRNWLVGAYVVEFEQSGQDRAKYGEHLLEKLAEDLRSREIKGLGVTNLKMCRLFAKTYSGIGRTLSDEFGEDFILPSIRQTLSDELKLQADSGENAPRIPSPLEPPQLLRLSWSHFQELIRIDDPWKRAFFETECITCNWSVRQLQRQIESLLYERTGLSTDKKAVIEKARKAQPPQTLADLIRDPYVLEFTNLAERPEYSEEDLESALLDHLQRFLLELGRGFCFEARQFRMSEGRKHHRVDLVFYHRLLRCHVLIDLKIRAFEPADAGQMNFYLNWFKAHMMAEGDNPPVGILLCSDKDGAGVEFATAGMDQTLFVSRYLVALPSPDKLRDFLEADRDRIESQIAHAASPKTKTPKSKPTSRKR